MKILNTWNPENVNGLILLGAAGRLPCLPCTPNDNTQLYTRTATSILKKFLPRLPDFNINIPYPIFPRMRFMAGRSSMGATQAIGSLVMLGIIYMQCAASKMKTQKVQREDCQEL